MKFSVCLPDGTVKPFAKREAVMDYLRGWPDSYFNKVWPLSFCCLIQVRSNPF